MGSKGTTSSLGLGSPSQEAGSPQENLEIISHIINYPTLYKIAVSKSIITINGFISKYVTCRVLMERIASPPKMDRLFSTSETEQEIHTESGSDGMHLGGECGAVYGLCSLQFLCHLVFDYLLIFLTRKCAFL